MTGTEHERRCCPFCGNGALDGHGSFSRNVEGRTNCLEKDADYVRRFERWEEFHCPDCDEIFAVREIEHRTHYEEVDRQ